MNTSSFQFDFIKAELAVDEREKKLTEKYFLRAIMFERENTSSPITKIIAMFCSGKVFK